MVYHCYHRALDKGVIFYSLSDFLMYFTIFCVRAVKYKVTVLKLVQMPDHIHQTLVELEHGQIGIQQSLGT